MEASKIVVFMAYPATALVLNVIPPPRLFTRGQSAGIRPQHLPQPWRPMAIGGSASPGEEGADCNSKVRWYLFVLSEKCIRPCVPGAQVPNCEVNPSNMIIDCPFDGVLQQTSGSNSSRYTVGSLTIHATVLHSLRV